MKQLTQSGVETSVGAFRTGSIRVNRVPRVGEYGQNGVAPLRGPYSMNLPEAMSPRHSHLDDTSVCLSDRSWLWRSACDVTDEKKVPFLRVLELVQHVER